MERVTWNLAAAGLELDFEMFASVRYFLQRSMFTLANSVKFIKSKGIKIIQQVRPASRFSKLKKKLGRWSAASLLWGLRLRALHTALDQRQRKLRWSISALLQRLCRVKRVPELGGSAAIHPSQAANNVRQAQAKMVTPKRRTKIWVKPQANFIWFQPRYSQLKPETKQYTTSPNSS